MKVITEGYTYNVSDLKGEGSQKIQFFNAEAGIDGTTNEELLEVLIHRMSHQHGKLPSKETAMAITKLQEAELWLLKRTMDRQKRNVEGTQEA